LLNIFHISFHFSESLDATTLVYFAISFYLLTTWTYGLSVSAGLFIPCLATGAAWGRLIGLGVQCIFPNVVRLINFFFLSFMYIYYISIIFIFINLMTYTIHNYI
jgi:H+/Cl- antiporter ClcA